MNSRISTIGRGVVAALFAVLLGLAAFPAMADPLRIAVAANFAVPAEALAAAFEDEAGIAVSLSSGSSGALFAQITQGAPFAVFLSADTDRPAALEEQGYAVAGSRFTYALGDLVLWSTDPDLIDAEGEVLRTGAFAHLAIANPASAPYGAAAMQVLAALELDAALAERIVTGESIAQTFAFVQSGNAGLGFVALSQLRDTTGGSRWRVPDDLHAPIRQDAVLLEAGNADAEAFLEFLQSPKAREIIAEFGYGLAERTLPAPGTYG